MDSATVNAYGSLIIAAANFGYAVWTKWSANRKVADANLRAANASQQATKAVDHSLAVGHLATANSLDLEAAKQNIDELFTARLEVATVLRRLDSNEKALLWLAGYVGVANGDDAPTPPDDSDDNADAGRPDDAATTTGRHRLATQRIATIPEGTPE